MKNEPNYIQDLADIRTMMERSSKFMSLSGLAGVMAGIYALAGVIISYTVFHFNPDEIVYDFGSADLSRVIITALIVLILAICTGILLSVKKANKREEKAWNPVSKRLIVNMAVPLLAGGILILILLSKELMGLIVPCTLLFYGLSLYNAGSFTFNEMKYLGFIQIALGLLSAWFIEYCLLFWAIGFGVMHIIYGIYMHLKYER